MENNYGIFKFVNYTNMKRLYQYLYILPLLLVIFAVEACSSSDDGRGYEDVKIVGVKVNGNLYLPSYSNNGTTVTLPSGMDLSNVQVQLLVANGKVKNFVDNGYYDCRKPMDVALIGNSGSAVTAKLRVQSPPKLSNLIIEQLDIPTNNIYISDNSIIVQVDKGTDLTALKVTLNFVNGTLVDFENGVARDYTNPLSLNVLGVDGETTYPYSLVITTDPVGPAFVKSMTLNGYPTTKVVEQAGNVLVPYVASITDFSSVNLTLQTSYGNKIDPSFTGTALNMLSGTNKVKITGTNGVITEFTIATPKLDPAVAFVKTYSDLGFAANDLSAVGFSGNYVLAANYTQGTKAPCYYDYSGNKVGQLSTTGCTGISYGFRKFTTDDNGVVIGSSLGLSNGEQWIYKWNDVTSNPSNYISFSLTSLGLTYSPRSAGLSVTGSLSSDAVVTMPMAQKSDVIVWKVSGGIVGAPQKFIAPITFGYYGSVEPLPGDAGYVLTAASANLNGIILLNSNFQEQFRITGMPVTDSKVFKYKGRLYLGYVAMINSNIPTMRICDITDGLQSSYSNPIFDQAMQDQAGNANVTTDVSFKVINDKLYVAFVSSNSDMYLIKLEQ